MKRTQALRTTLAALPVSFSTKRVKSVYGSSPSHLPRRWEAPVSQSGLQLAQPMLRAWRSPYVAAALPRADRGSGLSADIWRSANRRNWLDITPCQSHRTREARASGASMTRPLPPFGTAEVGTAVLTAVAGIEAAHASAWSGVVPVTVTGRRGPAAT